jgi:hypothetical protein
MEENLQKTLVRNQEPEEREPANLAGSGGARRNIKHLREVVKEFFTPPGAIEEAVQVCWRGIFFPRGVHTTSGGARGVLEACARGGA